MRTVVRNSFARQTIQAERVLVRWNFAGDTSGETCTECGQQRPHRTLKGQGWLYRFSVDDDQGSRHSGPIAGGKLFCSRGCIESYLGQSLSD